VAAVLCTIGATVGAVAMFLSEPTFVNQLAAIAVRAAIEDDAYVQEYVAEVLAARDMIYDGLDKLGVKLTDHGRLPAASYDAMERLRAAGLIVIPVTGRPAGWCDLIARQWPVDGVVGENGAFYFRHIDAERRMLSASIASLTWPLDMASRSARS
jgi:hypothetical protein